MQNTLQHYDLLWTVNIYDLSIQVNEYHSHFKILTK